MKTAALSELFIVIEATEPVAVVSVAVRWTVLSPKSTAAPASQSKLQLPPSGVSPTTPSRGPAPKKRALCLRVEYAVSGGNIPSRVVCREHKISVDVQRRTRVGHTHAERPLGVVAVAEPEVATDVEVNEPVITRRRSIEGCAIGDGKARSASIGSGHPAAEPARSGIVWLASYPKSGNTWTRAFLHNLVHATLGQAQIQRINELNQFSMGVAGKGCSKKFLALFQPTKIETGSRRRARVCRSILPSRSRD